MAAADTQPVSPASWLAVIGGVIAAFMAVLDIQITNASLRDIQGALSASTEESSWISTAYLVAEVVIIPMTGWLSRVFSIRRYMLASVALFLVFSVLCGFSWSLPSMIVFRCFQGLFGGALIPLSLTLIMILLPEKEWSTGMALFALSAVCAPSFGPALGGWLTETWSWQMIFFINLIPGGVMFYLLYQGLPRQTMNLSLLKQGDWFGIITMAIGLGSLQVVLEEGSLKDWFESSYIAFMSLLSGVALMAFLIRELTCQQPLINLRLFASPRFALGSLANMVVGFCLYSAVYLFPVYLAKIHDYSSMQIGLVIMWMGLPQFLIVPMVPKLVERFGSSQVSLTGIVIFAYSFWLSTRLSPDFAGPQFHFIQLIRAIGLPLAMTPLMLSTTTGIPARYAADASSLFNIVRNLGGAIGMAVMATVLSSRTRLHDARIREALPDTTDKIYQAYVGVPHLDHQNVLTLFSMEIHKQASIMAFADDFLILTWLMFVAGLLVWLSGRSLQRIQTAKPDV
ncbi:MDR family MFS transporter [Candidatus Sororendozoicomonas aggregata]|uniref:MDR family MFS transporter n=1 Tax=Candidatus Sororendozoicomonas aggregata TaxID=3073239 RepID=UPI002ED1A80E